MCDQKPLSAARSDEHKLQDGAVLPTAGYTSNMAHSRDKKPLNTTKAGIYTM